MSDSDLIPWSEGQAFRPIPVSTPQELARSIMQQVARQRRRRLVLLWLVSIMLIAGGAFIWVPDPESWVGAALLVAGLLSLAVFFWQLGTAITRLRAMRAGRG